MPDADDMLRAIREDPYADDLRLIYADALEECGEEDKAAFIRASMRLAAASRDEDIYPAHAAATELWRPLARRLPYGLPEILPCLCPHAHPEKLGIAADCFVSWRGLPEVWCVADVPTFEREAAAVFALHPIRRVVLRCGVPNVIGKRPVYDHPEDCSPGLWELLEGELLSFSDEEEGLGELKLYPNSDLARADLEAKMAAWGRSLADLPALVATT